VGQIILTSRSSEDFEERAITAVGGATLIWTTIGLGARSADPQLL
jgi:hypothetical protein